MYPVDQDPVALWAEAQVTALKVKKWPAYGSPGWRELKAEDPRRATAILEAAELWRRYVAEEDPLTWIAEATRERPPLYTLPDRRTLAEARKPKPPRRVAATDGWPPIAVPGQPGRRRHLVNGQQTDLNDTAQENAA
ncbi:MAG: hypothetical protein JWO67_2076 [Streptosporangiaceae bacterium]|nr:hypothetical protein [Streptosporangiaceae bacterium]